MGSNFDKKIKWANSSNGDWTIFVKFLTLVFFVETLNVNKENHFLIFFNWIKCITYK